MKEEADFLTVIERYEQALSELKSGEDNMSLRQEQSMVERLKSELAWSKLPASVKQQKRKGAVSLMKKWASQDGLSTSFPYDENLIDLYEAIDAFLTKHPSKPSDDLLLFRVRTMISIERLFIDERAGDSGRRHMDYHAWIRLFTSFQEQQPKLYEAMGLGVLNDHFVAMYRNWSGRPYKELQQSG